MSDHPVTDDIMLELRGAVGLEPEENPRAVAAATTRRVRLHARQALAPAKLDAGVLEVGMRVWVWVWV